MIDLTNLASSVLVTLFNDLASQMPEDSRPADVKKFSDKKAGIRRVEGLLEQVNTLRAEQSLPIFQIDETGEIEQILIEGSQETELSKVESDSSDEGDSTETGGTEGDSTEGGGTEGGTSLGSGETEGAGTSIGAGETFRNDEPQEAPKSISAVKPTKPARAKTPPRLPGGRPPSVSESDIITLVMTAKNPKRAAAADRFSCYRTGMTVGEYMDAIGGDRKQALRDISWDMKQGWITIAGAKGVKTDEPSAESETKTEEAA